MPLQTQAKKTVPDPLRLGMRLATYLRVAASSEAQEKGKRGLQTKFNPGSA